MAKYHPENQAVSSIPSGNPPSGFAWVWVEATGLWTKISDGTRQRLTPDTGFSSTSASTAPISHAAMAAAWLADETLAVTGAGSVSTNALVAFVSGAARNANAIAPNAVAATAYVKATDGANTRFYLTTRVSNDWTPDGGTIGQVMYLGANGELSLSAPPIANGNIIQRVGLFLPDGGCLIKIEEPTYIQI